MCNLWSDISIRYASDSSMSGAQRPLQSLVKLAHIGAYWGNRGCVSLPCGRLIARFEARQFGETHENRLGRQNRWATGQPRLHRPQHVFVDTLLLSDDA